MHSPQPTPWIYPWPYATKTIKRVWHISVTWHHLFFFTKKQSQKGGGHGPMDPPNTLLVVVFFYLPAQVATKIENNIQ